MEKYDKKYRQINIIWYNIKYIGSDIGFHIEESGGIQYVKKDIKYIFDNNNAFGRIGLQRVEEKRGFLRQCQGMDERRLSS